MTTLWHNRTTIARRLRVRGSQLDPILTQLRLSSLLSSMDAHPAGLAPSAILCIRALHDPLPGALQLQQCHHNIRPAQVWQQAITASLDSLARQAARPAVGPVPADAQAVIFTDRAELLACLASDWCESSISQRWWWQSLFKGMDIARTILPAWLEAPEYVPAALQHLSVMKKVVPFVCSLSSNDAQAVLQSITRSFALHNLAAFPPTGTYIQNPDIHGGVTARVDHPTIARSTLSTEQSHRHPAQPVPWQQWVPESADASFNLEQQCLLGIGLMLQRAPTIVRTAAFAHTVKQWYQIEHFPVTSSPSVVEIPVMDISGWDAEDRDNTIDTHTAEPSPPQDAPVTMPAQSQDVDNTISTPIQNTDTAHSTALQDTPAMIAGPMQDTVADMTPTPARSIHEKQFHRGESHHDRDVVFEANIETALGGLFYLINLGLFLNLYGDFTTPLQRGIPLSIWDFVALLGQQLLGEKIQTDPVWQLLAQLAGRDEQEAPGKDFEAPETWHLPVEWLKAFPEEGVWEWTTEEGRLRVRHAEGFLLLDVPLNPSDPVQQLIQEMQAYDDVQHGKTVGSEAPQEIILTLPRLGSKIVYSRGDPCGRPALTRSVPSLHPQVECWLDWLVPYIRARLIRALDVHIDDLPELLCMHHARVFVTATHLDIFLSLAELPIEIRLAGLDRNPSWVPAAGRFIAFHFD